MDMLAAIDIGTHSVRLLVVELHPDGTWTTLDQSKEYVRLGEGEFLGGRRRLTDEALERCARVIARFADIAHGFGAREVIALATAAAREASNQDELIERVAAASRGAVSVRVISGQEEARLIYLGVRSGIELPPGENALFMDIGGGSTELIVGDRQQYKFLDSLRMGAIRLTNEVMPQRERSVPPEVWHRLQRTARSLVEPAARSIRPLGFARMFGSSGTVISLAEINVRRKSADGAPASASASAAAGSAAPHAAAGASGGSGGGASPVTLRNYELPRADVEQIAHMLCRLSLEQRRKVPGLGAERADIIVAGAAIVQTVMESVGARSILISDRGLREGIVVDALLREAAARDAARGLAADAPLVLTGEEPAPSVRERSTRRLARRTQIDEAHAAIVTRLAGQLFDQTRAAGLHDLGAPERELLEYGSLLHDSGFFVSHTSHHNHSYYLVRHSELLGFNDTEIEIIAQITLYHRKGLPKEKNPAYAALSPREREVVRVLSCLVRCAEALDRSHLGIVTDLALQRDDGRSGPACLTLTVKPGTDPALEVWAAEAQAEAFRKTFGVRLAVAAPVVAMG